MTLDLDNIDQKDARLVQAGLKHFGFYDGTTLGVPGPRTKAAYERYLGAPADNLGEPASLLNYPRAVRGELDFPGDIKEGTKGRKARQVQEWLSIHGFRTPIDEDFGLATARALESFQAARGIPVVSTVDQTTWDQLVAPMVRAFSSCDKGSTLGDTLLRVAKQHLNEHPIEIGGANCGPWVRAYMLGNQGNAWAWCAGFVSFVMGQASEIHGVTKPISGSFSCDQLTTQARDAGRFVSEKSLDSTPADFSDTGLGTCCIFLVRRTSSDWTHTGFAFDFKSNRTFATIEGNTNDEGSREGFEVCKRFRGREDKDFIRLV